MAGVQRLLLLLAPLGAKGGRLIDLWLISIYYFSCRVNLFSLDREWILLSSPLPFPHLRVIPDAFPNGEGMTWLDAVVSFPIEDRQDALLSHCEEGKNFYKMETIWEMLATLAPLHFGPVFGKGTRALLVATFFPASRPNGRRRGGNVRIGGGGR